MTSLLETLPVELIETIVKLLSFRDVASLRHTSRAIESKASHASFTRRFHCKNLKLETKTLRRLAQLSNESYSTSRLQHCTVTGIVGLEEAASESAHDEHIRLLTVIFRNLKKNIQAGSIASLSLRVVLRVTRRTAHMWPETWATARRTFEITMAALNESNLSVDEHLDLFNSVPSCSLEYTAFLCLAQRPGPANIFKRLKRLTMSLSSPVVDTMDTNYFLPIPDLNGLRQGEHVALTLGAISHVSSIMPELESLDLHWFNIGQSTSNSPAQVPAHRDITSCSPPLALKECILRGVYISGINLLQFIMSTTPITLRLKDVNLVTGTYASSFRYITQPNTPTTYCHFKDLCQGRYIIHFDIPEKSEEADESSAKIGRTTLSQQLIGLGQKGIAHQLRPILHPRAKEYVRWRQDILPKYGPPVSRSVAFIPRNGRHIDVEMGV
ncbi:hypothetical protein F4801DRAFT_556191 [Xylaria longipes]|nr:hypothetical protein F4801DRAFT_556191 [Xylaria longipes]RYC65582.1 hypothetical protein CHU98_g652 [Xylaria longipes]